MSKNENQKYFMEKRMKKSTLTIMVWQYFCIFSFVSIIFFDIFGHLLEKGKWFHSNEFIKTSLPLVILYFINDTIHRKKKNDSKLY